MSCIIIGQLLFHLPPSPFGLLAASSTNAPLAASESRPTLQTLLQSMHQCLCCWLLCSQGSKGISGC
jgi:hypothetical protein